MKVGEGLCEMKKRFRGSRKKIEGNGDENNQNTLYTCNSIDNEEKIKKKVLMN